MGYRTPNIDRIAKEGAVFTDHYAHPSCTAGLANGQPFPSLGSRDKPVQNADGSTDLHYSPKAPKGKEANWQATVPGKGYFAVLRLYGPTEAAFDKSWKPGDFEKIK